MKLRVTARWRLPRLLAGVLLEGRADPNHVDDEDNLPLYLAAQEVRLPPGALPCP